MESKENCTEVICSSSEKYLVRFSEKVFDLNNNILQEILGERQLFVFLSPTVYKIYGKSIKEYFKKYSKDYYIAVLKTGEKNKNLESISKIVEFTKKYDVNRKSLFIAIGGGILTDMVGFAASIVRRKVDYLRIPTTLVGQIDAGIGIKTGVNFSGKKNFIGAFHPPIACINDISFLKTLNQKEIFCGLAEIIKMAIIKDKELFNLIERSIKEFKTTNILKSKYINRINYLAVLKMLEELEKNFYEKDLKRLVDFGHTFSPIIEEKTNYLVPHGLAVAMDILLSTEISYQLKLISFEDKERIFKLFKDYGYAFFHEQCFTKENMYIALKNAEEHRGGNINLVVPVAIGEAKFIEKMSDIPLNIIENAIVNIIKGGKKYV